LLLRLECTSLIRAEDIVHLLRFVFVSLNLDWNVR
jgi:hypothetical protein